LSLNDQDLKSKDEARSLVERAAKAQQIYKKFSQSQVDKVTAAAVRAGAKNAEKLAKLAVEESGFGRVSSKIIKNLFATQTLWDDIKELKTVGVIFRDDRKGVFEIAEPYGVVIGIVPVTNPTSTTLFKGIISLKTRNSIVFSPHPRGIRCISETAKVMEEAAVNAGAPNGLISCMSTVTMDGVNEAMRHPLTSLILATGGAGLVKAAYSAGKPAYGVGPGNAPAFIERTANITMAVKAIVASQLFDNGTICASEQSVVIDEPVKSRTLREFISQGAHLCNNEEKALLSKIITKNKAINPDIVGRYPRELAEMAGFSVPSDTTVLLAEESRVGLDYPLSVEKLSPILAVYSASGWEKCCEICLELLHLGGMGHTMSIHSSNEDVIMKFAIEKPVNRILVNAPTSQGAVGYATGLVPSMTLGCGAHGGNITSDNVSAKNLILTKRVARVKPGFIERCCDEQGLSVYKQGPIRVKSNKKHNTTTSYSSSSLQSVLKSKPSPVPVVKEKIEEKKEVNQTPPERCPMGGSCGNCETESEN